MSNLSLMDGCCYFTVFLNYSIKKYNISYISSLYLILLYGLMSLLIYVYQTCENLIHYNVKVWVQRSGRG